MGERARSSLAEFCWDLDDFASPPPFAPSVRDGETSGPFGDTSADVELGLKKALVVVVGCRGGLEVEVPFGGE